MKVLIADDDPQILRALNITFTASDYDVVLAADGAAALRRAAEHHPDIVVLDLGMPHLSGIDVIHGLRGWSTVPILVISGRTDSIDKVQALDAGADDYVTKPFLTDELLARVRALLRRASPTGDGVLRFADIELDTGTREVRRGADEIQLTRTEFNLLELFLLNPRQVLTRSIIFERVWGYDFGFASNSLDVYIGYLRRKTEAGGKPRLIHTVRGVGYALREQ